MALEEIQRKVSVGETCDENVRIKFTNNGIPFLTDCSNILIAFFAGSQKTPFVKFAYKTTEGFKQFAFEVPEDEAAGKVLLKLESEDTAKAIDGTVRIEMDIQLIDNTRTDLKFNKPVIKDIFKFV